LHGIEIVLDDAYSDDDAVVILDELSGTLGAMHPVLRAKLTQVLLPRIDNPAGSSTGATADGATGQVCFWRMRQSMLGLPDTSIGLLEHECAHLLFPGGGPPDDAAWLQARCRR
jgi:hypothetical protein